MSLDERVHEAEHASRGTGRRLIPWAVLGLVAVIVFELFAHPLLAASIFCLKFALNDFLTARWLFRRDENRGRAWACSLLYVAVGFWKAAVINYGILTAAIAYTLLSGEPAWPQRDPNGPAAQFLDDPITPYAAPSVIGHALEFFLGMLALGIAYANCQKLWLSPRINLSRKLGEWPPFDDRGVNWLAWRPALTCAALPVLIWGIGFPLIMLIPPSNAVNAKDWLVILPLHSFFGGMLTLPVLLISGCVQDRKNRYLLAQTPEECWGERDFEPF